VGVASLQQDVLFGAYHEECRAESEHKQAGEIDVATIHDIKRTGFRKDLIQNVHIMHFAVGNADKRGNIAVQVQQRVHFNRCLVLAKFRPGKQRETKVNRGRVQSVQTLVQLHSDGIVSIQRSCDRD